MENSSNNGNLLFSSKDSEEIRTMHSISDNIEILIGNETGEIIENLFDFFFDKDIRND